MASIKSAQPIPQSRHTSQRLHSISICDDTATLPRSSTRSSELSVKINPSDFENFFPWLCYQFELPVKVKIIKKIREPYISVDRNKGSMTNKESKYKIKRNYYEEASITSSSYISPETETNSLPITIYYDDQKFLVEIRFVKQPFIQVPPKIFKLISICTNLHPMLANLSIEGNLTKTTLHEISNLLRLTNITQVCLDDTYVQEGNYYEMLDGISSLKYLSINRCRIGDKVCLEVAKKLASPSQIPLLVLEASSNCITDVGAEALGNALKVNRKLLHLNLAGNLITSKGAALILDSLKSFPLTSNLMLQHFQYYAHNLQYYMEKQKIYQDCQLKNEVSELHTNQNSSEHKMRVPSPPKLVTKRRNTLKSQVSFNEPGIDSKSADNKDIFLYPFNKDNVCKENGVPSNIGNLVLCSLNLAYNNIDYLGLKSCTEVLKYQNNLRNSRTFFGLLRLNIEGNYIPEYCTEYDNIKMYLQKALSILGVTERSSPRNLARGHSQYKYNRSSMFRN